MEDLFARLNEMAKNAPRDERVDSLHKNGADEENLEHKEILKRMQEHHEQARALNALNSLGVGEWKEWPGEA